MTVALTTMAGVVPVSTAVTASLLFCLLSWAVGVAYGIYIQERETTDRSILRLLREWSA